MCIRDRSVSGASINAPGELWIRLFVIGHRPVDVGTVHATLVEGTRRPNLIRRATILPNEPAQVAESLAARESPEGLFTEVERDRGVFRRGHWKSRHRRGLKDAL